MRSGIAGRFPFPGGVVQASATKLDVARAALEEGVLGETLAAVRCHRGDGHH